jgi:hypothetical protein
MQINKLLNFGLFISTSVVLLLLFSVLFNKGTIVVNAPSDTIIYVNSYKVATNKIRLKPGNYTIRAVNQRYKEWQSVVKVGPFQTKTISPSQDKATENEIVQSALGPNAPTANVALSNIKYFQNGSWFVGTFSVGSLTPVVMHYDGGWIIEYLPTGSYLDVLSNLPPEIGSYVQKLLNEHIDG